MQGPGSVQPWSEHARIVPAPPGASAAPWSSPLSLVTRSEHHVVIRAEPRRSNEAGNEHSI